MSPIFSVYAMLPAAFSAPLEGTIFFPFTLAISMSFLMWTLLILSAGALALNARLDLGDNGHPSDTPLPQHA